MITAKELDDQYPIRHANRNNYKGMYYRVIVSPLIKL